MNPAPEQDVVDVVIRDVEDALDTVFRAADALRDDVVRIWGEAGDGGVSPSHLAALQPRILRTLEDQPYLSGCGFVADLDVLAGPRRYWEWWTPSPDGTAPPQPLLLRSDGGESSGYAYEGMAWFSGARQGVRTVVGPYLDFAGADRFVLTCAEPVTVGDRFVGVTGADVLVPQFETILLTHLRRIEAEAIIVNRDGRVVTSTTSSLVPGERYHGGTDGVPVDLRRAGWSLHRLS